MKKKKKKLLSTVDIIYICAMLCVLLLLIISTGQPSDDPLTGNAEGALTYYLSGESGSNIPSWIVIIPSNIWVDSNADCGSYTYKNGVYTFFLNEKELYTAEITEESLVVRSKDNGSLHYTSQKH